MGIFLTVIVGLVIKPISTALVGLTGVSLMALIGFGYVVAFAEFLKPLLVYWIYPPTQKQSPAAPAWAKDELKKMGSISLKEILMGSLAFLALILWIFSKELNVDTTIAAISITVLMVSMIVLFCLLHYLFASVMVHTTALLPIFIVIVAKLIVPDQLMTFMILLTSTIGLMRIITPYGTGSFPLFGMGLVIFHKENGGR